MICTADLGHFDVGPMVRLVSALRDLAPRAGSLEQFAQSVCALLHQTFVGEAPQTALVRFYGTAPLGALPPREQAHVAAKGNEGLPPTTTCLALLGTAGTLPEWNQRSQSKRHLALPLVDAQQVATMPMIAALLSQLGIDAQALTAGKPEVMLESVEGSCRIFYVADAAGSPLIPDQDFVAERGIVSAVGFGGSLPTGEVFAVVMFCTVAVPLASAELFETVALSIRLAALDMLELPLFEGQHSARTGLVGAALAAARARSSQELLRAHEHISARQADVVQQALEQARQDASRAAALAAVALQLARVTSVSEVAQVLTAGGLSVVGADGMSVALLDGARDSVDLTLSAGFGPDAANTYARLPLDDTLPTTYTARTGQVVILEDVLHEDHDFPELLAVARDVGVASLVTLPMWAGADLIGALTCTWDEPHRIDGSALELVHALAAQSAQAIDRSRLLEREREHSTALQRSLLTEPPEPDHCQIVVRYLPAAETAQVGGDWHDSFLQQDGATVLVVGDVVGHDTAAAAAMGQVRGLLRGIGWYSGSGPADLLSCVDLAMEGLLVHTTASCVVARIEQSEDERGRGVTHLRWSNAGHPPPMVINPDGSVLVLAGLHADLLLGVDPETRRVQSEVTLDRGATVVFYTDGLVERRGRDLDDGLEQLRSLLEELGDLELNQLCDVVVERLLPGADDDIALLAVRLHRQDRPRPPEAGPERVPPNL